MATIKILIRSDLPSNTTIDSRSTRFLLIGLPDTVTSVHWQIYRLELTPDFLPDFDFNTPFSENNAGMYSSDVSGLDILLPENTKYKVRVQLKQNNQYSGWTSFFEFVSKKYKDFSPFLSKKISKNVVSTQGATIEYMPI